MHNVRMVVTSFLTKDLGWVGGTVAFTRSSSGRSRIPVRNSWIARAWRA